VLARILPGELWLLVGAEQLADVDALDLVDGR
jgi:hypothetical protein